MSWNINTGALWTRVSSDHVYTPQERAQAAFISYRYALYVMALEAAEGVSLAVEGSL
jgi:hypothetical protein